MSSRGYGAAVGVMAALVSLIAGLAVLVVLGYVEVHTGLWLLAQLIFHGDPIAGFALGLLVLAAAVMLVPVDVGAATLVGVCMYKALRRRDQV